MPEQIRGRSLVKRYPNGAVALQGVDLTVGAGERVALAGPSGSGKTTLLRTLNATIRPTAGELWVLGQDVNRLRHGALDRFRRRVAMVHQNHNLVQSLSVYQNVLIGRMGRVPLVTSLKAAVYPSDQDRRRVYDLLDRLDIADKLYTRVDDLSGGQQQRVAIARSLYQEPEILLADEPIASVDQETATSILELLTGVSGERGVTLLVSLHQRQYIERFFDRLVDLRRGHIVSDVVIATPERARALELSGVAG